MLEKVVIGAIVAVVAAIVLSSLGIEIYSLTSYEAYVAVQRFKLMLEIGTAVLVSGGLVIGFIICVLKDALSKKRKDS